MGSFLAPILRLLGGIRFDSICHYATSLIWYCYFYALKRCLHLEKKKFLKGESRGAGEYSDAGRCSSLVNHAWLVVPALWRPPSGARNGARS